MKDTLMSVHRSLAWHSYDLYIHTIDQQDPSPDDRCKRLKVSDDGNCLEWARYTSDDSMQHHPPAMRLSESDCQKLLDSLLLAGIRPSSGEGNTGQLGATKAHLEDMRKLVAAKLKVEL